MEEEKNQEVSTSENIEKKNHIGFIFPIVILVSVAITILGVYFRISTLEMPVVWHDEVTTLIHSSGFSGPMMSKEIAGKVVSIGSVVKKYQTAATNPTMTRVYRVLKHVNPEHAPVFVILISLWQQLISHDLSKVRWVPVIISFLQLPVMFWLGYEVTRSIKGALISMALMAISPLQLWYAQELREYCLMVFTLCFSSAAFLCAMRTKKIVHWLIYMGSVIVGFYSSSFTLLAVLSHIAYMLILERPKIGTKYVICSRHFAFFSVFLFVGLLACLPEFVAHISGVASRYGVNWLSNRSPMSWWLDQGLKNLFLIFYDGANIKEGALLHLSILLVIFIYSLFVLWRRGQKSSLIFLACFAGVTILFFGIQDVLKGGSRLLVIRYVMPVPLTVLLAFAYAVQLQLDSKNVLYRLLGPLCCIFVLACGVLSCETMGSSRERMKVERQSLLSMARIVKWDEPPMIVTGYDENHRTNTLQIVALGQLIDPKIKLLWTDGNDEITFPYDWFMVMNPPEALRKRLQDNGYKLEPATFYREKLDYILTATKNGSKQKSGAGLGEW